MPPIHPSHPTLRIVWRVGVQAWGWAGGWAGGWGVVCGVWCVCGWVCGCGLRTTGPQPEPDANDTSEHASVRACERASVRACSFLSRSFCVWRACAAAAGPGLRFSRLGGWAAWDSGPCVPWRRRGLQGWAWSWTAHLDERCCASPQHCHCSGAALWCALGVLEHRPRGA